MGLRTIYYQQKRHHIALGKTICPIMLFKEELVWEIKNGNKKDEIIILMMDANEDHNKGKFSKGLTQLVI